VNFSSPANQMQRDGNSNAKFIISSLKKSNRKLFRSVLIIVKNNYKNEILARSSAAAEMFFTPRFEGFCVNLLKKLSG
jgi:hypothetical protein